VPPRVDTSQHKETCPFTWGGECDCSRGGWDEKAVPVDPALATCAVHELVQFLRAQPSSTRRSEINIAEDAITLFLEYRDKHGHSEPSAMVYAVNEFSEAELFEAAPSATGAPRWVPVSERMPEDHLIVVALAKAVDGARLRMVGHHSLAGWILDIREDVTVTHWCALPPSASTDGGGAK
jgi:hypothetical protein